MRELRACICSGVALALLVGGAGGAFGAGERGKGPPPRIVRARFQQEGIGPAGPEYRVLMQVGAQVAAEPGPLTVRVRESIRIGRKLLEQKSRTFSVRQARSSDWHNVKWWLDPQFFGVGKYEVQVSVVDSRGRASNVRSKSWVTAD